jgi:hypothetical protein
MLCNHLVHIIEHLRARSAVQVPPEPIFDSVRLYISSLRYLLDLYAMSGKEGMLTPRRRFDENSKLHQEFLGVLNAKLDEGLRKALRAVFPHLFDQKQTTGVPMTLRSMSVLHLHPQPAATSTPTFACTFALTSTSTTAALSTSAPPSVSAAST